MDQKDHNTIAQHDINCQLPDGKGISLSKMSCDDKIGTKFSHFITHCSSSV